MTCASPRREGARQRLLTQLERQHPRGPSMPSAPIVQACVDARGRTWRPSACACTEDPGVVGDLGGGAHIWRRHRDNTCTLAPPRALNGRAVVRSHAGGGPRDSVCSRVRLVNTRGGRRGLSESTAKDRAPALSAVYCNKLGICNKLGTVTGRSERWATRRCRRGRDGEVVLVGGRSGERRLCVIVCSRRSSVLRFTRLFSKLSSCGQACPPVLPGPAHAARAWRGLAYADMCRPHTYCCIPATGVPTRGKCTAASASSVADGCGAWQGKDLADKLKEIGDEFGSGLAELQGGALCTTASTGREHLLLVESLPCEQLTLPCH